ncbi:hypothetical protein [Dactylosporangium cerinum]
MVLGEFLEDVLQRTALGVDPVGALEPGRGRAAQRVLRRGAAHVGGEPGPDLGDPRHEILDPALGGELGVPVALDRPPRDEGASQNSTTPRQCVSSANGEFAPGSGRRPARSSPSSVTMRTMPSSARSV